MWSKPAPEYLTYRIRYSHPQLQTIPSVIIPRKAPSSVCQIIARAYHRSIWLLTAITGSELARFRQIGPALKRSLKLDSRLMSA